VAVDGVSRDNCEQCADLLAAARDARVRLHHAADEEQATRRAYEDHEATHGWKAPRKWDDAPPVAVTWQGPKGVTYTFAPDPTEETP
jgi:hypothetical protein